MVARSERVSLRVDDVYYFSRGGLKGRLQMEKTRYESRFPHKSYRPARFPARATQLQVAVKSPITPKKTDRFPATRPL